MPAATIEPPTEEEVANVDPMSGAAVNPPPPPPAPGPIVKPPPPAAATNGAAPSPATNGVAPPAQPGPTPPPPAQAAPPGQPQQESPADWGAKPVAQPQAKQQQPESPTDWGAKPVQAQPEPPTTESPTDWGAKPVAQHVDTDSIQDQSTDEQVSSVLKQVTENPNVDPGEGAEKLYPLLQKQRAEQAAQAGTGAGAGQLAEDATNLVGGFGTGLYHWQGGVRSLANTGDAVARITANVFGSMPFQDVEDDLKQQLKDGKLDQAGFDAAMAKVNQAADLRQRQVDLGPGAATTPEGIKAQQASEDQIAQLLTQADKGFAQNHVQQALLEAIHGGKLSFDQTAKFLDNVLGPNSWDPTTYFGNASTLQQMSKEKLKDYLVEEQKVNVPLVQDKAGKVSPIEQSVANNINAIVGQPVVTNDDLIKRGYGMSEDKAEQVANGIELGLSFLPGLEGEGFAEGTLKAGSLGARATATTAKYVLAKARKWTGLELLWHAPDIIGDLIHPGAGTAVRAVKGVATAVAAKATETLGNVTADVLDSAAKAEYQGNPLWYQFAGRTARELTKGAFRGVPYAALTSESPEQFGQTVGGMAAMHAVLGMPTQAVQGFLGGTGDALFVPRKGVANTPVADIPYGIDPATGQAGPRLDAISATQAKTLTKSQYGLYTRVKQMMSPYADIYLVSPAELQAQQAAFAHAGGKTATNAAAFSVDSASTKTGRAAVFVDPAHFDQAFLHDAVGHPAYWMLPQDMRQGLVNLIKSKNDPVAFTKRYNGLDYNALPTTDEVNSGARAPGPNGYSKDLMDQEMAAEQIGQFFNGKKISDWTKDDGAIRQMKNYVGKVLESYGLPSTTIEANTEGLELQPSVTSYLMLRNWLRGLAENRGGPEYTATRVTGGVPPPEPEAPPPVTHEAIQQRAHEISQQRIAAGHPGDETSDWLQAERELTQPAQPQPAPQPQAQPQAQPQPPPAPGPQPVDETAIKGLMKKGFTREQALDFLQRGTIQQQGKPPPAPGPIPQQPPAPIPQQPQQQPAEQGPELAGAEEPPAPSAPVQTEAEQDALHAKIRGLTNQGVPAGEAHARAQGKTPQTLQQKQGKSTAERPVTAQPGAAAPAQAAGLAVPAQQQQKQHEPIDTLKADDKNRVDPVSLYSYLLGKFSKSSVLNHPPADGEFWKVKTGSAAEWAAFALAVAKQESDLNARSYNSADPGGSAGLFQFGQGQKPYVQGDQFDPQQSADAFVRAVEQLVGPKGRIANLGKTFGSILRPNEAGQYLAGAQRVAAGGSGKDLVSSGGGGGGGGGGTGPGGGGLGGPRTAAQQAAAAQSQAAAAGFQPSAAWAQIGHAGEAPAAPGAAGAEQAPPSGAHYEAPGGEAPEENVYSPQQAMMMAQQRAMGLPGNYPPAAPGGLSAAFMPKKIKRALGGLEPEEEEEEGGEPIQSTVGVPQPKGMAKIQQLINGGKLAQALKQHAKLLSPDDSRVTKQADNYTKGEHFVEGDPAHEELLGGLPGGKTGRQRNLLGQGEQAIADKSPMHLSYISAPKEAQKFPTRASRTQQYEEHTPEARLMGTTQGQLVGHSMIPVSVGVSPKDPANGEPHQGYIQGISTNVMANNFQHTNRKLAQMGEPTPYPKMGDKFHNDLEGYVQNLNAGHRGTGDAYAPGTEEYPSTPDKNYVPYPLKPNERDFLGTVINNTGAFANKAQGLRELARKGGTLLTEAGQTNPMQQRIEQHEPGWRANVLEPSIRSFRTGLIHDVHETEEHMPAEIRPGKEYQELTKSLSRAPIGGAAVPLSVGFMPLAGRKATGWGAAEKEGRVFKSPIHPTYPSGVRPSPGAERFEISDRDMKLKPAAEDSDWTTALEHEYHENPRGAGVMKLSAALDHPELFKNYPQLRNTKISYDPTMQRADGFYEHPWTDEKGKQHGDLISIKNPGDRDTLAHEIQHAVQYVEGFPGGDSPEAIYQDLRKDPAVREEVHKNARETFPVQTPEEFAADKERQTGQPLPKRVLSQQYNDYVDTRTDFRDRWIRDRMRKMATNVYQRSPGEMEARVAGARAETPGPTSPLTSMYLEKQATERYFPRPPELEQGAFAEQPPAAPGALHTVAESLPEHIRSPAIRVSDEEPYVYEGTDHWMAANHAKNQGERIDPDGWGYQQGFTTSKDRFVDRKEAWDIAARNDQLRPFSRGGSLDAHDLRPEARTRPRVGLIEGASGQPPAAPVEQSAAFRTAGKAAEPKKQRLIRPDWETASEDERQKYLEEKVRRRIGEQYVGPETHKLEVQRNAQGGVQYDPNGDPVYVKHDYDIANSPLLKKKGLNQIKDADEHEDTLDPNEHTHLSQIDRRRLSALRKASARETMADKIVDSFNSMKGIPEVAAGQGWYSRMRQKLAEHLGEHHELFAQLLGATSAKTPVRENFMQALDALEQLRSGKYDKHVQKYLEAQLFLQLGGKEALTQHMRDEGILRDDQPDHETDAKAMAHWVRHHNILPLRQNGQKYNANSMAVLKALAGTWLHEVDAPKTPNFAGNLTGRTLEATIDVWAARHLQRLGYEGQTKGPWRATAAAEPGVSSIDFAFSQDAMRRATEKLAEQGIKMNPDDLQAILWYGEKHHYDQKGWTRGQGAEKGSFDEVADMAFPKTGEGMNSKELRDHYRKVSLADKALEYESHANPKMRAKMEPYMKQHGIEQHHLERARLDKKQEELAEAA